MKLKEDVKKIKNVLLQQKGLIKNLITTVNTNKIIVVPTNKINRYVIILDDYKREMKKKSEGAGMNISANKITKKKVELTKYLNDLEFALSKNEYLGIQHRIELHVIPTLRLLVKDYKK